MEITASMVKELREMTGAGMMDCKKALNETGGNMDEAVEFLRKNGQAKAEKKASRIAAEGLSTVYQKDDQTDHSCFIAAQLFHHAEKFAVFAGFLSCLYRCFCHHA